MPAFASAWVAVGLVKKIRKPMITSFNVTSEIPATNIIPRSMNPAPNVSVTLAACMRV